MIAPRTLVIEAAQGPQVTLPPGMQGAPAELITPALEQVKREAQRAESLVPGLTEPRWLHLVVSGDGTGPFVTRSTMQLVVQF